MKNKKPLLAIILGVAAVALVAGLFIAGMDAASRPGKRPEVGSKAPDFSIPLYEGYRNGLPEKIKLSDLQGKVVVMNVWASWCVECRKESDALEALHRAYKDKGLVMLGVDYLDTEKPAREYLKQYNTTYAVGEDLQQNIARAYRITGVPETFFIDKKGVVREVAILPLSEAQLNATVAKLLAE